MNLKKNFERDFNKARAALEEIIDHNRMIDAQLVNDLAQGDLPTEALVPELWSNTFTGNFDKVLGVNIR